MLKDKVVIVVGGGGLLGSHFCDAIAAAGAVVVVADSSKHAGNKVVEQLAASGYQAKYVAVDIGNDTSVKKLIETVCDACGHIDAVVNTAYPRNKQYGRLLENVTYRDFCENLSLHVGGYFLVTQQFAMYFSRHGGGSIVNLSSIYGSMAPRFEIYANTEMTMPVEYAAIKSAIQNLTKYFAQFYKKAGVRCNSLAPGGIYDHQDDSFIKHYASFAGAKGMLSPEDCVGTLLYLISDSSRYVTGQNIIVDDGFSL